MSNRPRWFRIGVLTLIAVLLGGAAYLLFYLQAKNAIQRDLTAGEKAYQAGVKALEEDNPGDAVEHFHKARLLADKALEAAEKRGKENLSGEDRTQLAEMVGEIFWLRARVLRDQAFAQAASDGQPLTISEDTSLNEPARSAWAIPDLKARDEIIGCLRQAAYLVPQNADVLNETLRTETARAVLDWPTVERIARALLRLEPDNTRALFVLARFEYEQPATDSRSRVSTPTPEDKRNRDRMVRGVEYLEKLKGTKSFPLWRTLYLEARMRLWLRDAAARRGLTSEEQTQEKKLQALVRRAREEGKKLADQSASLPKMSTWDMEGVFGMQHFAIGLAVQAARRQDGDLRTPLAELDATFDFANKVVASKPGSLWLEQATLGCIAALSQVEPLLVADPPARWNSYLDTVQTLGRAARDAGVSNPMLYTGLAGLMARESYRQGRKANPARQKEMRQQALVWVEDGLRMGEKNKRTPAQLAPLNGLAAELKMVQREKRDKLQPHITALRAAKNPEATASAARIEGAVAEREGRLDAARKHLEEALTTGGPEQALRVHVVLGGVYLTLGDPVRALTSLAEAEKAYVDFDKLSPWDRAWMLEFTRSPDDVRALLAVAHLEAARHKAERALRQPPSETESPAQVLRRHERAAEALIAKLPANTPQNRFARLALVRHRTQTGDTDRALEVVKALRREVPDSVDVLRAEVALVSLPPRPRAGETASGELTKEGIAEADQRIKNFLDDNPRSQLGKLFRAEWLVRTRRANEAVKYLQDRSSFPDRDESYQRILAVALLARGDRDEGVKVLKDLPRDPNTDALMIRVVSSVADRQKMVSDALSRYENAGLFRCMEAEQALVQGKYEDAARSFCRAVEFTRVRGLARTGILRALGTLADREPAKSRQLCLELMKTHPSEPTLYLAHAYASLLVDEVGQPRDSWDNSRTMAAGVNRWEQLQFQDSTTRIGGPLMKGRLWMLANRPDVAREEVLRAIKLEPRNVAACTLGLQVALTSGEPDLLADGRKYLAILREAQPDNPEVVLFEVQIDRAEGKIDEAIQHCQEALSRKPHAALYAQLAALLREQPHSKQRLRELSRQWRKELPGNLLGVRLETLLLAEEGKVTEAQRTAEQFREDQLQKEKERLARLEVPTGVVSAEWDRQQKSQLETFRLGMDAELGRALLVGKAYPEARKWAQRMIDQSPEAIDGRLLLAEVCRHQGDWKGACENYRQVLEKQKGNLIAGNNLAWLLLTKLEDPQQAYTVISRLRQSGPGGKPIAADRLNPEFLSTLGQVYQKLGKKERYVEMRDVFEAARRRYPRDPRMSLYLGYAYLGLDDRTQADRMFRTTEALSVPEVKSPLSATRQMEVLNEARTARARLAPPKK